MAGAGAPGQGAELASETTGTAADRPPGHGSGRRRRRWLITLAAFLVAVVALILLWQWDWFIPIVESRASAALGRKVTIQHLHVRLGGTTVIVLDDLRIANPKGFDQAAPLATVGHLKVAVRALSVINGPINLPLIDMDHPVINATARPDGASNWSGIGGTSQTKAKSSGPPPKLGVLRIEDGHVHVIDPKFKTDMALLVHTTGENQADGGRLVATAKGTYAHQPITGRFIGGALLEVRDRSKPYPVDLHVANGPTRVALTGTVDQPLTFAGANLKLVLAGPDMALLLPLTGVPIPHTPPYKVAGNLDYQKSQIVFDHFHGTVGSSDLSGRIAVEPHGKVPHLRAALTSHKVDLNDLAGFIGAPPGDKKDTTSKQKQQIKQAGKSGDILPTHDFNVPSLRSIDVHLTYKGDRIEGRYVPLDNIVVALDIDDGRIRLHPLNFAVGQGTIESDFNLDPVGDTLHTKAHVRFRHVNLSRIMQATHAFHGEGLIGGQASLTTTGNSVASMLGNGNGGVTLIISGKGNISALLDDIAGLEFGNAILSALGVPQRADLRCFVGDMPLDNGILSMKTFLLQTSEARSIGRGTIDLRNQTLNYSLTTRSTHFSIGSLPGPIDVTGKLGNPTVRPGAEVVGRAAAAAGLGVLFVPLAILPTVQFGVGNGACTDALQEAKQGPAAASKPASPQQSHSRHPHRR